MLPWCSTTPMTRYGTPPIRNAVPQRSALGEQPLGDCIAEHGNGSARSVFFTGERPTQRDI